jgi:hypothetical protein
VIINETTCGITLRLGSRKVVGIRIPAMQVIGGEHRPMGITSGHEPDSLIAYIGSGLSVIHT